MEVVQKQIHTLDSEPSSRARSEGRRQRGSSAPDTARGREARRSRDHRAGGRHRRAPPHARGHTCTVRSSSSEGARLDWDQHRQEKQQDRAQLHGDDLL